MDKIKRGSDTSQAETSSAMERVRTEWTDNLISGHKKGKILMEKIVMENSFFRMQEELMRMEMYL